MKKRVVVFVLILICVLSLIIYNSVLPKKHMVSNNNSYSDLNGVFVEIDSMCVYPDITTLIVSWNNETEQTITYGEMYSIERFENGEWIDCSLKDNIFTLIGYTLKANEKVDKEYRLTDMYDVSKSGTYRFHSTCSADVGDVKEYSVWAEFVID